MTASFISGCARINSPTFKKYYQAGMAAERNEDYAAAKENFYRALVNARIGPLGPKETAAAAYSYGRMLGVYCDYQGAEELLQEAKRLDQETNGPVHMALVELARLKMDQGDYQAAVKYYGQAIALVDKKELIETDPAGFAVMFREYSAALSKVQRTAEAESFAARADALTRAHPGSQAVAERTPYGLKCAKDQPPPLQQ
jgi:tetratricopeptide (TPR) repeat protein